MTTFNREDSIDLPVLAAAPEAPEAGRKKLYIGSDGKLYTITEAGVVSLVQLSDAQAQMLTSATPLETGGTLVKRDGFGSVRFGTTGTGGAAVSIYEGGIAVSMFGRYYGHLKFVGDTANQGRIAQLVELFQALPTADPHVAGQPWNNAGVVTISAG